MKSVSRPPFCTFSPAPRATFWSRVFSKLWVAQSARYLAPRGTGAWKLAWEPSITRQFCECVFECLVFSILEGGFHFLTPLPLPQGPVRILTHSASLPISSLSSKNCAWTNAFPLRARLWATVCGLGSLGFLRKEFLTTLQNLDSAQIFMNPLGSLNLNRAFQDPWWPQGPVSWWVESCVLCYQTAS